jgi:hypothetical protein
MFDVQILGSVGKAIDSESFSTDQTGSRIFRALHQELKFESFFGQLSAYCKFEARNPKFETSTNIKFSNDKNKDREK